MDTMLVLVGPQGALKSTFVPSLFGRDFTSEDLADLKSKDAMIGLAGKWAIEVAELDKILRTDPETVKAFISRCVDPYRAPS
jgi:predicted P-loop ATPase